MRRPGTGGVVTCTVFRVEMAVQGWCFGAGGFPRASPRGPRVTRTSRGVPRGLAEVPGGPQGSPRDPRGGPGGLGSSYLVRSNFLAICFSDVCT